MKSNSFKLDFIGFADGMYDPIARARRNDVQGVNPLDHFLVRGEAKVPTDEKGIETKRPSLWSNHEDALDIQKSLGVDPKSSIKSFHEPPNYTWFEKIFFRSKPSNFGF